MPRTLRRALLLSQLGLSCTSQASLSARLEKLTLKPWLPPAKFGGHFSPPNGRRLIVIQASARSYESLVLRGVLVHLTRAGQPLLTPIMPTRIFLDIETLPPAPGVTLPPAVLRRSLLAPGQEDAAAHTAAYRQLALNGAFGRLLCIGVIVEQEGHITQKGVLGREPTTRRFHLNEARLLRGFWKLLRGFQLGQDLLVGFNILDFDLLFICQRSIVNQVPPSVNLSFARYRRQPIYDVMWEFTHWHYKISLDQMACALGLTSSKQDGLDGAQVYDYFCAGRHEEVADYCLRDVELTRQLYYQLHYTPLPETLPLPPARSGADPN